MGRESDPLELTIRAFSCRIWAPRGEFVARERVGLQFIRRAEVDKRVYTKPVLTVRTITLGVFGSYGGTGPDGAGAGGNNGPRVGKRPTESMYEVD